MNQVAEWMGRREAWSAEKSSDSRTKPAHGENVGLPHENNTRKTQWEFRRRDEHRENIEADSLHGASVKRVRSADDKRTVKIK